MNIRFSGEAVFLARLPVTCDLADRLVRLPLWLGLEEYKTVAFTVKYACSKEES